MPKKTAKEKTEKHEWFTASFYWGSWIECTCGFRPSSQEEKDEHIPPNNFFKLTFGGRSITVEVSPEDSVWDAFARYTHPNKNDPGFGDFEERGYRVFAPSALKAYQIVNELIALGIKPRTHRKTNLYFSPDGNWGVAADLIVIDSSLISEEDSMRLGEMSDSERYAFAAKLKKINEERK